MSKNAFVLNDLYVVKSHRPNDPRLPHSYHTYCIMTYICNDIIVSRACLTGPRDEVPDGGGPRGRVVREPPLYSAAGII